MYDAWPRMHLTDLCNYRYYGLQPLPPQDGPQQQVMTIGRNQLNVTLQMQLPARGQKETSVQVSNHKRNRHSHENPSCMVHPKIHLYPFHIPHTLPTHELDPYSIGSTIDTHHLIELYKTARLSTIDFRILQNHAYIYTYM